MICSLVSSFFNDKVILSLFSSVFSSSDFWQKLENKLLFLILLKLFGNLQFKLIFDILLFSLSNFDKILGNLYSLQKDIFLLLKELFCSLILNILLISGVDLY